MIHILIRQAHREFMGKTRTILYFVIREVVTGMSFRIWDMRWSVSLFSSFNQTQFCSSSDPILSILYIVFCFVFHSFIVTIDFAHSSHWLPSKRGSVVATLFLMYSKSSVLYVVPIQISRGRFNWQNMDLLWNNIFDFLKEICGGEL